MAKIVFSLLSETIDLTKTKINRHMLARAFPRMASAACIGSDWFVGLPSFVVIGQYSYFGLSLMTLNN